MINDIPTCQELVERIMREAEQIMSKLTAIKLTLNAPFTASERTISANGNQVVEK